VVQDQLQNPCLNACQDKYTVERKGFLRWDAFA
jgi:hypothetical protein